MSERAIYEHTHVLSREKFQNSEKSSKCDPAQENESAVGFVAVHR